MDDSVIQNDISSEFLGVSPGTGQWNKTYGDFTDGSARRRELVMTNHRLLTHNKKAIAVTIDWLDQAIGIDTDVKNTDQTFLIKELLVLIAMFSAIASMFALLMILLNIPFFSTVAHPEIIMEREDRVNKGWKWWRALITILIAGLSYPFMTVGHGLLPLRNDCFQDDDWKRLPFLVSLLGLVMLLTTILSWKKSKRKTSRSITAIWGFPLRKERSF